MHHTSRSPCKNCSDRSWNPPCHDICEKYLSYHKDMEIIRKARQKENYDQREYIEQILRRKDIRDGKKSKGS